VIRTEAVICLGMNAGANVGLDLQTAVNNVHPRVTSYSLGQAIAIYRTDDDLAALFVWTGVVAACL